ncbi:MAG: hypothetical protein ACJ739_15330 [Acidimicrobiales bacterium]
MSTILSTVEGYEDQILQAVKDAKPTVVEYVSKGVELVGDRLPSVTYPASLATPIEVVESQTAFVKKLIDANTALVTAVLETVAPLAGYKTKKATKPAVKAA